MKTTRGLLIFTFVTGSIVGSVGTYLMMHKPAVLATKWKTADHDQGTDILGNGHQEGTSSSADAEVRLGNSPPHWVAIRDSNYRAFIHNLRALGTPEMVIKDIVIPEIEREFAERWRRSSPLPDDWAFWKATPETSLKADHLAPEVMEMQKEQQALIQNLFGEDVDDRLRRRSWSFSPIDRINRDTSFLSPDRQAAIRPILERSISEAESILNGDRGETHMERIDENLAKRLSELSQFLSPEEVEGYELRASPLANGIRHQYGFLDLTPDEFRQIYRLAKSNAEQINLVRKSDLPLEVIRERESELHQSQREAIKQFLGPKRAKSL